MKLLRESSMFLLSTLTALEGSVVVVVITRIICLLMRACLCIGGQPTREGSQGRVGAIVY